MGQIQLLIAGVGGDGDIEAGLKSESQLRWEIQGAGQFGQGAVNEGLVELVIPPARYAIERETACYQPNLVADYEGSYYFYPVGQGHFIPLYLLGEAANDLSGLDGYGTEFEAK